MANIVTITFTQWSKWNPRKDIKHPTWFAMSNRITEDDQIQELTDAEFRAFIHLTCMASQQNKPTADINLTKTERLTGIKKAVVLKAIEKLCAYGICTRSVRDPSASVQIAYATLQDTTEHNTTEHNTREPEPARAEFDFESLYKSYPRKEGNKEQAARSLKEQIRDQESFDQFAKAVFHYAALMKHRKTETKYTLTWSSFVGTKRTGYPWRTQIDRPPELDSPSAMTADQFLESLLAEGAS